MDESDPDAQREAVCQECGEPGARQTRVTFVDTTEATLTLCGACAAEFEAAVFVEEVHVVTDSTDPDRT